MTTPRATRPTDGDAFGDLPSPDEYAANGYALKPKSRYDREHGAWLNRAHSAARTAIAVTDTADVRAAALLAGGDWIQGPFRPIWSAPTAGHQLGWISDRGVYVAVGDVQARTIGGAHGSDWAAYLAAEPAEDCELSLAPVNRDDPNEPLADDGATWWCHVHESTVPIVTVAGVELVAEHDRRGRRIEHGRTVLS